MKLNGGWAPTVRYPAYIRTSIGNTNLPNNGFVSSYINFRPSGYQSTYPVSYYFSGTIPTNPIDYVTYFPQPYNNISKNQIGFIAIFGYSEPSANFFDTYYSSGNLITETVSVKDLNTLNVYSKALLNLGKGNDIVNIVSGQMNPPIDINTVPSSSWRGEYYFSYTRDSYYNNITQSEDSQGIPCWIFERAEKNGMYAKLIVEDSYYGGPSIPTRTNSLYYTTNLCYKILDVSFYLSGEKILEFYYASGLDYVNGRYYKTFHKESPITSIYGIEDNSALAIKQSKCNLFHCPVRQLQGVPSYSINFGLFPYHDILPISESVNLTIDYNFTTKYATRTLTSGLSEPTLAFPSGFWYYYYTDPVYFSEGVNGSKSITLYSNTPKAICDDKILSVCRVNNGYLGTFSVGNNGPPGFSTATYYIADYSNSSDFKIYEKIIRTDGTILWDGDVNAIGYGYFVGGILSELNPFTRFNYNASIALAIIFVKDESYYGSSDSQFDTSYQYGPSSEANSFAYSTNFFKSANYSIDSIAVSGGYINVQYVDIPNGNYDFNNENSVLTSQTFNNIVYYGGGGTIPAMIDTFSPTSLDFNSVS